MAKETKYMIGAFDAAVEKLSTGDMAALGVFYSLETCLNFLFGQGSLQNRTIAIQGLGKLGAELLRLLYVQGAKIVASDASLDRLEQLHKQYPKIKMVAPSLIHKQVCDVYAPCALGGELNLVTVSELKTKIVCGGSNNQLASSDLAKDLYKRGILYAPDYVVNSGGLINVVDEMEPDGYKKERVLKRVKGIAHTLADILNQAKAENLMPLVVADRLAGSIIYSHTLKKINGQAQNYGTAAAQ